MRPLNDNLIIRKIENNRQIGNLVMPENYLRNERYDTGEVLSVARNVADKVQVGAHVLYDYTAALDIGEGQHLITVHNIYAIKTK